MPLYLVIIVELARGRGLAARLLSIRPMKFFGETGYSIFIWQNFVMIMCWLAVMINPALGRNQLKFALLGIVLLGVFSTYVMEKPFANWLRRKFIKP